MCCAGSKRSKSYSNFLSGLDEVFTQLRSQMLHMRPLPTVEQASNMLHKGPENKCTNCGKMGHTLEQCWACKKCGKSGHEHEKGKRKQGGGKSNNAKNKGPGLRGESSKTNPKGNKGKKLAGNVKLDTEGGNNKVITAQQLEQILRMLPNLSTKGGEDTKEEMD
ncbi:Gag-Pol polyprotein [Bienertia sinuspersici]